MEELKKKKSLQVFIKGKNESAFNRQQTQKKEANRKKVEDKTHKYCIGKDGVITHYLLVLWLFVLVLLAATPHVGARDRFELRHQATVQADV